MIPQPFEEAVGLLLHESLGEDEAFHRKFGYYADIVRPKAAELFPEEWESRLVPLEGVERVFCLEPHDMAASKCLAGRDKDIALLTRLFQDGKLDAELVEARLRQVTMRESTIVKSHRALAEAIRRGSEA